MRTTELENYDGAVSVIASSQASDGGKRLDVGRRPKALQGRMQAAMGVATVLVTAGASAFGQTCGWDAAFGDMGTDGVINAMIEFNIDGDRVLELVVGGNFAFIGGSDTSVAADNVAYWDNGQWFALGDAPGGIDALAVFQGQLYAGGAFEWLVECPPVPPGGLECRPHTEPSLLARWDGTAWVQVGGVAFGDTVRSLVEFNGWLYVGGHLGIILDLDPSAGTHIARWNGASWGGVGSGVGDAVVPVPAPGVWDMVVYDDGGGPDLYVGGVFQHVLAAPNSTVPNTYGIARWDGSAWSAVGGGLTPICDYPECECGPPPGPGCIPNDVGVRALAFFSNGPLYAGGDFQYVNDVVSGQLEVNHIARWDRGQWSQLVNVCNVSGIPGANAVDALEIHDDGTGPALFAAGTIGSIDCQNLNNIAKWHNSRWFTLGGGINSAVKDLLSFSFDGSLIAGGFFDTAYQCRGHVVDPDPGGLPVSSRSLGKWDGECPACPADTNCDGSVNVLDLIDVLLCFGMATDTETDPPCDCDTEDINLDCVVNVLDLVELLLQFDKTCP